MHLNAAPTGGPHGMGLPMAVTVEHEGERLDGLVTGVYVSPDLMGIATHAGERIMRIGCRLMRNRQHILISGGSRQGRICCCRNNNNWAK